MSRGGRQQQKAASFDVVGGRESELVGFVPQATTFPASSGVGLLIHRVLRISLMSTV